MCKYSIILASKSKGRKMLLKKMGVKFQVKASKGTESYPADLSPDEIVMHIAKGKLGDLKKYKSDEIVISADTLIHLEGEMLGKPKDIAQAREYLERLSGKKHQVVTGVCIALDQALISFSETSVVEFEEITPEDIKDYVNDEALSKSGGYGLQDEQIKDKIKIISGFENNVIGLPTEKLRIFLKSISAKIFTI